MITTRLQKIFRSMGEGTATLEPTRGDVREKLQTPNTILVSSIATVSAFSIFIYPYVSGSVSDTDFSSSIAMLPLYVISFLSFYWLSWKGLGVWAEHARVQRETQFAKFEELHRSAEFGQMASGLFHDLVNVVNAGLLEVQRPDMTSRSRMHGPNAHIDRTTVLSKQVNDFVETMRRQLANNNSQENFWLKCEIETIIRFLSYPARKHGVRVLVTGDDIVLFGNCFKFHQAVKNLILNAIESYDGVPENVLGEKTVVVAIGKDDRGVVITVSDRGTGIPDEIQGNIFKPFFTTKPGGKGMGLGLAIVKKVIENDLQGTVQLVSPAGEGSSFRVTIPLRSDAN
jgi:two-component system C4-dicarboxylate transport sensor histidine kinase DctB